MALDLRFNRRKVVAGVVAAAGLAGFAGRTATTARAPATFSYPMALPGRPVGDGFFVRHGFSVENTWYLPGFWHAGEDWYPIEGDTGGMDVSAVADGDVVYVGGNYPGLVVIVRHADDLFSMYGHLEFGDVVSVGDTLASGDVLGAVLPRADDIPSHLHFEMRTFLQTAAVNGDAPLYGFGCGPDCPPGPGYWPIDAPELPSAVGWLNPTHVIANRWAAASSDRSVVVPSAPATGVTTLWSAPEDLDGATALGEIELEPGARFPVLRADIGADAPAATSAEAYRVWYELAPPVGESGWVRGVVADTFETGSDGRASTVRFNLVPDIMAPA